METYILNRSKQNPVYKRKVAAVGDLCDALDDGLSALADKKRLGDEFVTFCSCIPLSQSKRKSSTIGRKKWFMVSK